MRLLIRVPKEGNQLIYSSARNLGVRIINMSSTNSAKLQLEITKKNIAMLMLFSTAFSEYLELLYVLYFLK